MNLTHRLRIIACLTIGVLAATTARAQAFGASKEKVTLQRKLPAMVHLTGETIKVKVDAHENEADLASDLQSRLETELLKNDPQLRADDSHAATVITCHVSSFAHPPPTIINRPSLATGKNASKTQAYQRITGSLSISFQAHSSAGATLISDNVTAKYDQEFDSNGNTSSNGVMGTLNSGWKRIKGGTSSEDLNPPTDAELRDRLMRDAVRQIAQHIVNTTEIIEVFLAKQHGALDEGDKQAQAGLWQRALETYETAPPETKQNEDAYRLYDIGVAYEALAYKAEDAKAAMKFLDEAAINYGKAIDAKPSEKYFLDPQKRIETAIAHYRRLEEERAPKPVEAPVAIANAADAPTAPAKAAGPATGAAPAHPAPKALTNAQVIAMVKAGMDDDTVAQAVRAARAVNFDLTEQGQKDLTGSGVSAPVLTAMKTRAARKPAATTAKPAATATK